MAAVVGTAVVAGAVSGGLVCRMIGFEFNH
jgi:hypothetical protein